jgi:hypothetical protein
MFNGVSHDQDSGLLLQLMKFDKEIAIANMILRESILNADSEEMSEINDEVRSLVGGEIQIRENVHPSNVPSESVAN